MYRFGAIALVLTLMGACLFDWEAYEPRATTSTGAGGAGGSATGSPTGGGGGGGADPCSACGARACGTLLSETFGRDSGAWVYNGSAHHDGASGSAVLTEAVTSAGGSVFHANAILLDSFVASFEVRITLNTSSMINADGTNAAGGSGGVGGGGIGGGGVGGGGTGGMGQGGAGAGPPTPYQADGMAFAIQSDGPTGLGLPGGGLGVVGLSGWGAKLDTYQNTCDPSGDHAAIVDLAMCGRVDDATPTSLAMSGVLPAALVDTGWHVIEIGVAGGAASLSFDGSVVVSATALPASGMGLPRYIGFGAGTGGGVSRHEVRNLSITFPTPRCL